MFKEIKIQYDIGQFINADYSAHTGSCIVHQVDELKDIHTAYEGFPSSYNVHNTIIHQLWWDQNSVDFQLLGQQLGMEIVTVSSILQPPGNIIPLHRDTFFQIKKRFPQDIRKKIRANIFLEDWKVGHLIQYKKNNQWITHTNWQSGEGLLWDDSILHIGANIGFSNKYTLQVSGFSNE
jgi:hypothetical protein